MVSDQFWHMDCLCPLKPITAVESEVTKECQVRAHDPIHELATNHQQLNN